MIPPSMKYNAEGSAPNFSDTEGMVVERGSQVRLRIKGIRGELGSMYAIGSIREDYLGYDMSHYRLFHTVSANRAAQRIAPMIFFWSAGSI